MALKRYLKGPLQRNKNVHCLIFYIKEEDLHVKFDGITLKFKLKTNRIKKLKLASKDMCLFTFFFIYSFLFFFYCYCIVFYFFSNFPMFCI